MTKLTDDQLPEKYTPCSLQPPKSEPRKEVVFALGEETRSTVVGKASYAIWHGPNPDLEEMLEVVGKSNKSCIVRFNLDGTDEVLYRWTQYRNGKPPCWVKEKKAKK